MGFLELNERELVFCQLHNAVLPSSLSSCFKYLGLKLKYEEQLLRWSSDCISRYIVFSLYHLLLPQKSGLVMNIKF